MTRRRMINALASADQFGDYEDVAVMPEDTDPQVYLSRNRLPQPFHLLCEKDTVLSALSGAAYVHLRDNSVLRFRMEVGDHVYVPAGTPHQIVPIEEGVMLRYLGRNPGRHGAAWYCGSCDAEVRRYEWQHDNDTPSARFYAAACARFTADEAARTCPKCGTVHDGIDLAAYNWSASATV
jgi:3-hydroxyanthranilate 3,4-dioxygenase